MKVAQNDFVPTNTGILGYMDSAMGTLGPPDYPYWAKLTESPFMAHLVTTWAFINGIVMSQSLSIDLTIPIQLKFSYFRLLLSERKEES